MVRSWLFLLFLFPFGALASDFYRLDKATVSPSLSKQDETRLSQFFGHLEGLLPAKLKSQFPQGIQVQFQQLPQSHGRAAKGRIILNSNLLSTFLGTKETSAPSLDPQGRLRRHRTLFKETQDTVLHETAHLYDFKNIRTDSEKSFIQNCWMMDQDPTYPLPSHCEIYLKTKTTFSTDPYYLEVAGWPLSVQGKNHREEKNRFAMRTVDPYELKDPREHVAVNFAYFLLDEDFKCRRPTLYSYFESHFQHRPFKKDCGPLQYIDPSSVHAQNLIRTLPVERVYQIHYLHAGPGKGVMSRWGHSMFRLVVCSPDRKKPGPECMMDEHYHVVLSFRAFVDTLAIESWNGLTGKYPSRLFFVSLKGVKESYNINEFRNLISYPLNLTSEEKIRFLQKAIETHWTYDNQYYFLSNNCASESLDLLRSSTWRAELLDKKAVKPTELLDILLRQRLIVQGAIKKNPTENKKAGLLFDNHGERYRSALSILKGQSVTLDETIRHIDSDFLTRHSFYQRVLRENDLKAVAATVLLEDASLRRSSARTKTDVLNNLLKGSSQAQGWVNELKSTFDRSIELMSLFSAPYEFVQNHHYGIPDLEELHEAVARVANVQRETIKTNQTRNKLMRSQFSQEQLSEIDQTRAYLDFQIQRLQALALGR